MPETALIPEACWISGADDFSKHIVVHFDGHLLLHLVHVGAEELTAPLDELTRR